MFRTQKRSTFAVVFSKTWLLLSLFLPSYGQSVTYLLTRAQKGAPESSLWRMDDQFTTLDFIGSYRQLPRDFEQMVVLPGATPSAPPAGMYVRARGGLEILYFVDLGSGQVTQIAESTGGSLLAVRAIARSPHARSVLALLRDGSLYNLDHQGNIAPLKPSGWVDSLFAGQGTRTGESISYDPITENLTVVASGSHNALDAIVVALRGTQQNSPIMANDLTVLAGLSSLHSVETLTGSTHSWVLVDKAGSDYYLFRLNHRDQVPASPAPVLHFHEPESVSLLDMTSTGNLFYRSYDDIIEIGPSGSEISTRPVFNSSVVLHALNPAFPRRPITLVVDQVTFSNIQGWPVPPAQTRAPVSVGTSQPGSLVSPTTLSPDRQHIQEILAAANLSRAQPLHENDAITLAQITLGLARCPQVRSSLDQIPTASLASLGIAYSNAQYVATDPNRSTTALALATAVASLNCTGAILSNAVTSP